VTAVRLSTEFAFKACERRVDLKGGDGSLEQIVCLSGENPEMSVRRRKIEIRLRAETCSTLGLDRFFRWKGNSHSGGRSQVNECKRSLSNLARPHPRLR